MLAQSSEDQWSQEPSVIDDSVRTILIRCSELIRATSDLGLTENPTALGILSRQLLEAFISLQWVISDEKRAVLYSEFSINELDRLSQLAMKDGLLSVKLRQDNSDITQEFLANRGKPKKSVSIEQQAREAGIFHVYQVFYRFMSLDMHGKSETIMDRDERREATVVHLHSIGAISRASGHVAILWLMHRKRADNEKLRELLGLNESRA